MKNMKISRELIDVCRARKKMSVADLAEAYGVSRARMNVILNQREVSVGINVNKTHRQLENFHRIDSFSFYGYLKSDKNLDCKTTV